MTDTNYMRSYRRAHAEGVGPIVACACGCGQTFRQFDYNRRPRRFALGHGRVKEAACGCGCGKVGRLCKGLVWGCYLKAWKTKRRPTA